MGTYDIIQIDCPFCHELINLQTKVLRETISFSVLKIGSVVDIANAAFRVKDKCDNCKCDIYLLIVDYKIVSAISAIDVIKELPFGSLKTMREEEL